MSLKSTFVFKIINAYKKKKIAKLYENITIYSVFNSAFNSAQFKKIEKKKLTLGKLKKNKYVYIEYKGKYVSLEGLFTCE